MKIFKFLSPIIISFVLLPIAIAQPNGPSTPERMSYETHTLIIKKLQISLKDKGLTTKAKHLILKRLGDIYSERARLTESSEKCPACATPRKDRLSALNYYSRTLNPKTFLTNPPNEKLITQVAHLYNLLNKSKKSKELYQIILKIGRKHYSRKLIGKAHFNIATISYQNRRYKKALKYFKLANLYKVNVEPGIIKYYQSWCYFNLGQEKSARTVMLSLLKQVSSKNLNPSLHDQASKDLATFYSRNLVSSKKIKNFFKLSRKPLQLENLKYLASESDRLGSTKNAIRAWKIYIDNEKDYEKLIEAHIHLAHTYYLGTYYSQSINQLQLAKKVWGTQGCENNCVLAQKKWKALITKWSKEHKSKPRNQLLQAYSSYNKLFKNDLKMLVWEAQLAMTLKKWRHAISNFQMVQSLSKSKLENTKNKKSKKFKELKRVFISSLLGQIDASESLKSKELKLAAYKNYLKYMGNTPRSYSIRYQISYTYYQDKDYKKSAQLFKKISLSPDIKNKKIRRQSAHLSLDSLALLKKNKEIIKLSKKYKQIFPQDSLEFISISRKARLNWAAEKSKNNGSSESEIQAQLNQLNKADLRGASLEEKITLYKNKMSLSESLKDLPQAKRFAQQLAQLRGLDQSNKKFALKKIAYYSEMILDFQTALRTTKITRGNSLKFSESELLKLAILSELSNKNPTRYYKQFIKKTRSLRKANKIRSRLVLRSSKPWTALTQYKTKLAKTPGILAETTLNIFAKYRNIRAARKILNTTQIKRYESGRQLDRIVNHYSQFNKIKRKIENHKIRFGSQNRIARYLQERLNYLSTAEGLTNKSAKSKDWILQISYLALMKKEYLRAYKEILALPAPKNMKDKMRDQYKLTLKRKIKHLLIASKLSEKKLDKLWDNDKNITFYTNRYDESPYRLKKLHKLDIKRLYAASKNGGLGFFDKRSLSKRAHNRLEHPSRKKYISAKRKLSKNPFDEDQTLEFKKIAHERSHEVMVAYLNARLQRLEIKRKGK